MGRLMGRSRRGREHESFSGYGSIAPPELHEDEGAPNIVILNSLTHTQLMELLKVRRQGFRFC